MVLFDGDCNLCNRAVRFLTRIDKKKVLSYTPLQSELGQKLLQQHGLPTQSFETMVYIDPQGRALTQSTAALHILKATGGLWQLLYIFILVPPFIRDLVYTQIAKRRKQWWGTKGACAVLLLLIANLCGMTLHAQPGIEGNAMAKPSLKFAFFLNEPTMLLNWEQDNRQEGHYLTVAQIDTARRMLWVKLPENFYLSAANAKQWVLGWGDQLPYYDAGCENSRQIKGFNLVRQGSNQRVLPTDTPITAIALGKITRGKGYPHKGQSIVFWNTRPSGFVTKPRRAVVNPQKWAAFAGPSVSFSKVVYDSLLRRWVMLFNECDNEHIQIYAAVSKDLKHWKPTNNGAAILTPSDFSQCTWAGLDPSGKHPQAPFASDLVYFKHRWYLFLDGYDSTQRRSIGVAISAQTALGPYTVQKQPLLSPGPVGSWNSESCFYAKVKPYRKGFVLFYDGMDAASHTEKVGLATSDDLLHWQNSSSNPVLEQHEGWRSSPYSSEPAFIDIRHDSIVLLVEGRKSFNTGPTGCLYCGKSGNVDDAQLGAFLSIDGGKTFAPHLYNPLFTNDYTNLYENEHMGGNFTYLLFKDKACIIYQGKSSYPNFRYNVLLRVKKQS